MTITKLKTTMAGGLAGAILLATPMAVSAHGAMQGHQEASWRGSDGQHSAVFAAHKDKHPDPQPVDCSARQTALNNKVATYKASATKQLGYLNNFYSMVQTYVSANGLTVTNYDSLNAAVATNQTSATNAVNAISAPTLNCDSNDQGMFNNSIKTAADSLKVYKHDLNSLLNAVLSS